MDSIFRWHAAEVFDHPDRGKFSSGHPLAGVITASGGTVSSGVIASLGAGDYVINCLRWYSPYPFRKKRIRFPKKSTIGVKARVESFVSRASSLEKQKLHTGVKVRQITRQAKNLPFHQRP